MNLHAFLTAQLALAGPHDIKALLGTWIKNHRPGGGKGTLDKLAGEKLLQPAATISCPQFVGAMPNAVALLNQIKGQASGSGFDKAQGQLLKALVYYMTDNEEAPFPVFRSWPLLGQADKTTFPFTQLFNNKHVALSSSTKQAKSRQKVRSAPNNTVGGHAMFGVQTNINALIDEDAAEELGKEVIANQKKYAAAYEKACRDWLKDGTAWKPAQVLSPTLYSPNGQEAFIYTGIAFQTGSSYKFTETRMVNSKVSETDKDEEFWYSTSFDLAGAKFAINHYEANPPNVQNETESGLTYRMH